MRLLVGLALALGTIFACNAKRPTPQQEPAVGSAKPGTDPWNAAARSTEPVPNWAHDPPAVLRDKILALNAHVIVLKSTATFAEYRDVLALAEHTPGVVAAEAFDFSEFQIAKLGKPSVVAAIKAVDPSRVARVLGFGPHMKAGTLDSLGTKSEPPPMVIGDDLARKLAVQIGDTVTVTSHDDHDVVQPTTFRITGLFHLDFDEYDGRVALVPLATMQGMLGRGDQVMGIEMTVKDLAHSDEIAKSLEKALGGPPYQTMDWYELNANLFHAMYGDRRP